MSLREEQSAFWNDIILLSQFALRIGFEITEGEGHRTTEQQKLYVEQGKSKTMQSYHLNRLAHDLFFFKAGALIQDKAGLQEIGDYWESLHPLNSWGGNWSSFIDTPHFERRYRG